MGAGWPVGLGRELLEGEGRYVPVRQDNGIFNASSITNPAWPLWVRQIRQS